MIYKYKFFFFIYICIKCYYFIIQLISIQFDVINLTSIKFNHHLIQIMFHFNHQHFTFIVLVVLYLQELIYNFD